MNIFTLDRETINDIDSKTIYQQINSSQLSVKTVEIVMDRSHTDKLEKLRAMGKLGVCLSLVHQNACQVSQLEKFLNNCHHQFSWVFNPKEFNLTSLVDGPISPLEYVIRFTSRLDVISCVISSINDATLVNDTFFSRKVYDTLNIARKKLFIRQKFVDVNHQHTGENPSLVLNRLVIDKESKDFSEIKMLLDSGADPHLVDTQIKRTFIQLAGSRLDNNQFLQLVKQLDDITSFHLLLYLYENISNVYPYEGLYFTFHVFYKHRNYISFQDVLRYISILTQYNFGDKENENKYLDTYIYLSYLIQRAEKMNHGDTQALNELKSKVDRYFSDITRDYQTILNLQKQKKSSSEYRILPGKD